MSDIVGDLRKLIGLNGDTYSSAEVIGLVCRAINEIEELRAQVAAEQQAHEATISDYEKTMNEPY